MFAVLSYGGMVEFEFKLGDTEKRVFDPLFLKKKKKLKWLPKWMSGREDALLLSEEQN